MIRVNTQMGISPYFAPSLPSLPAIVTKASSGSKGLKHPYPAAVHQEENMAQLTYRRWTAVCSHRRVRSTIETESVRRVLVGDIQQERYLFGSTHYYERAIYSSDPRDQVPAILRETPPGYRRISSEAWVEYSPLQCEMPKQGWKAHVSGTPKNYSRIVGIVTDFCFRKNMVFKVVPNLRGIIIGNSKSAPRESSGKLATIYARDEAEFEAIVKGLAPLLSGFDGPYILSDLQIEDSQFYVRYGAFCLFLNFLCLPPIRPNW